MGWLTGHIHGPGAGKPGRCSPTVAREPTARPSATSTAAHNRRPLQGPRSRYTGPQLPPTPSTGGASMLQEFKAFLMRGNVLDLAVGLVIGAAFTAVVTSFVNDLLMPPIGRLLGRVSFTDLFVSLDGRSFPSLVAAKAAGAPTLNYGVFIRSEEHT